MAGTEDTPPPLPYALYLDERMVRGLLAAADIGGGEDGIPMTGERALFRLLGAVESDGLAATVETIEDLASLRPGQLVDLRGTSLGNPLARVLAFVAAMLPLTADPAEPPRNRAGRANPGAAKADAEDEQVQRVLNGVVRAASEDLRAGPVLDVLVSTHSELRAVLTLDRSLLGAASEKLLTGRQVRVVGKVSALVDDRAPMSLFRHGVLAAAGPQGSRELIAELSQGGLALEEADPIVEGPALEVLPFAVLV